MKVPAKIINNHLQSVEEDQGYKTTFKQRAWLKLYLETKNATEAAMQVYDCKNRNVANAIGAENLAKLSMSDLMDAMGMTDDYLMEKVQEGLEKPSRPITVKTANGLETKLIPDYQTRHKYVDTALKLKKKLNTQVDVDVGVEVNVNVEIKQLAMQLQRIYEQEDTGNTITSLIPLQE